MDNPSIDFVIKRHVSANATAKTLAPRLSPANVLLPRLRLAFPLLILLAGILSYSNTFQVPFLFDDSVRIIYNSKIRTLWPPTIATFETNRPVVNYSFAMNYALHGLDVWGYHVANLAIHLAAGLCLFGIVRRSLKIAGGYLAKQSDDLALMIALIWVVHPLQTQAVTYINQRYESMMGLMYLLTLYGFVRSITSKFAVAWQAISIVVCGLGMGCKEAMVSAPLIVLWYDRAFIASSWSELFLKRRFFYGCLASTWGILAWAMLHYTDEYVEGGMVAVVGVTPWTYLLSQSEVLVHYLRLAIWPQGLCFFGKWRVAQSILDVWPQGLFIVSLLIATIWSMFRQPKLGFLGGWFFLILAPTSSFIPIRDFIFEHRMYLSLATVSTLFVIGLFAIFHRIGLSNTASNWSHRIVCFGCVCGLAVATYQRNRDYRSEISIWQDTVVKAPHHAEAWHNLGLAYINDHRSADAIPFLSEAINLAPNDAKTNSSYGGALVEIGQYEQAKQHLLNAIRSNPDDHVALRNMGNLLLDTGQVSEAIEYCQRAVELAPPDPELNMSLAAALIVGGRFQDAIELCRKTLDENPSYTKAHLNMVSACMHLGKIDDAIRSAVAAVQSDRNNANAQGMLGILLVDSAPEQAIEHLKIACELDATNGDYPLLVGKLLAKNNPSEAISYYQKVVVASPDNIEVRYKLASLYVTCRQLDEAIAELETIVERRPESMDARNYLRKLREAAQHETR